MRRCVGIDLGGTAIKAGAVDEHGRVLAKLTAPTELERGSAHVLATIARLARELGATDGVGLGVPGLIDRDAGVITECPNLKVLENVPLASELASALGCTRERVFLENDANAAALGEHWCGGARDADDVLFVTLGTGVGGGLVLGGELFTGRGGLAGEIGHVVVEPGGRECGCGARGCVETLASATAARRRALERGLPREAPGDLARLAERARASAGPERELCTAIGRDLGHALAAAVSLLDVRTFVIGGGFGAATDVLADGVRAGIRERSYGRRLDSLVVVPSVLGADAGWIGAARPLARRT